MTTKSIALNVIALVSLLGSVSAMADKPGNAALIERGRYLIATTGCNDCHTPGYGQADGNLPVSQWLTGSVVGFQGPWGTTYPANLRLALSTLTEEQWLVRARTPMRPPMPWFSLREMKDVDLRAIYYFVRSLQPVGNAVPAYASPGVAVSTPYFDFVPKNMNLTAQRAQ